LADATEKSSILHFFRAKQAGRCKFQIVRVSIIGLKGRRCLVRFVKILYNFVIIFPVALDETLNKNERNRNDYLAKGSGMKKNVEQTTQKNCVAIAIAEDAELAREYVKMLRDNEIPARFSANDEVVESRRVTILVPEEFVEQAQCLIQARNSSEDFCEYIYGDGLADKLEEMEE
jgi:hypothetical protein